MSSNVDFAHGLEKEDEEVSENGRVEAQVEDDRVIRENKIEDGGREKGNEVGKNSAHGPGTEMYGEEGGKPVVKVTIDQDEDYDMDEGGEGEEDHGKDSVVDVDGKKADEMEEKMDEGDKGADEEEIEGKSEDKKDEEEKKSEEDGSDEEEGSNEDESEDEDEEEEDEEETEEESERVGENGEKSTVRGPKTNVIGELEMEESFDNGGFEGRKEKTPKKNIGKMEEGTSSGPGLEEWEEVKRKKGKGKFEEKKKDIWYLIAQVRHDGTAIGARMTFSKSWPELVKVFHDPEMMFRPFEMGDRVAVERFVWEKEGREPKFQWIRDVYLNWQAEAVKIAKCVQPMFKKDIGLVIRVDRKLEEGDRLKSAIIASAGLSKPGRLLKRHLPNNFSDFEIAYQRAIQIMTTTITNPPKILFTPHYVLPEKFRFRNGNESAIFHASLIAGIGREPVNYGFPFGQQLSWDELQVGEKVLAAAEATHIADVQEELDRYTFITSPVIEEKVSANKLRVSFMQTVETVEELVRMCKVWEADSPIAAQVDLRIEGRPCANGYVINLLKDITPMGYSLTVRCFLYFQENEDNDVDDDAWEEFQDMAEGKLGDVRFIPLVSVKALRKRMELLNSNMCSLQAKGGGKFEPDRVMSILLGRPIQPVAAETNNPALGSGPITSLKQGQKLTAAYMMDAQPRVVWMQAPPGTGKTYCAASIVAAILNDDPTARILVTAPQNVAVVKLTLEMARALEEYGEGESKKMVALFSGNAKVNYAREVQVAVPHMLAAAVEADDFQAKLEEADMNHVDRYIERCRSNPKIAQELLVARILQENDERTLIAATLSLAEQCISLFSKITHVVADEAGQAVYTLILTLLQQLPALKKVLLCGDHRQLGVHLPALPMAIRHGFGQETVIRDLDSSSGADLTSLTVSYRSHPVLVRCLHAAFYQPHGEQLTAGRSAGERALLAQQQIFKLPRDQVPLILIHQRDQAYRDELSTSSTSRGQTETAMRVLWRLVNSFPNALIRCLCFYSTQAEEIERKVRGTDELGQVLVSTVDACQGHECELSVVVTTCATYDNNLSTEPFWAEPERADVALSRARMGMVVIGNFQVLYRAAAWRRYIDQAVQETVVVTPDYLNILRDSDCYYDRDGELNSANGRSVRSVEFYRFYDGNRNESGPFGGGAVRYKPYNLQRRGGRGGRGGRWNGRAQRADRR